MRARRYGSFKRACRLIIVCAVLAGVSSVATTAIASAEPAKEPERVDRKQRATPDLPLSSRLQTLAEPSLQTTSTSTQARALSLPATGPGSLARDSLGRVVVEIRVAPGNEVDSQLLGAGAEILSRSTQYGTLTALVAPGALTAVAAVRGVESVEEVLRPMVGSSSVAASTVSAGGVSALACSPTVSEGDTQLKANAARTQFSVDGSGVKVGVLSDSYAHSTTAATSAATDITTGDLPGIGNPCSRNEPVAVLDDSVVADVVDEGRALLQIVHDLAPGSPLAFATASAGSSSFATNIGQLAGSGARVIADDISYFDEPFFQEGPINVAVNNAVAGGAAYVSAAGNDNVVLNGQDVSSYESPAYRGTTCPLGIPPYQTNCHDFNPGATSDNAYTIGVKPGKTIVVDLQYAQPWYGVSTDIDAYLLSSGGSELAYSEAINVSGSRKPFEILGWTNTTASIQNVRLVIARYSGLGGGNTASPRVKFVLFTGGADAVASVEYPSSTDGDIVGPTIFGHGGGVNTISAGAVPYDSAATPEPYSSRGPVTLYFGPVTSTSPAGGIVPIVSAKPDVAATDGGRTTFLGENIAGVWRFYGTSAAAAHTAGVVALLRQHDSALSATAVGDTLKATAAVIPNGTSSSSGAGLVDAVAALTASAVPLPDPLGPPRFVLATWNLHPGEVRIHFDPPLSNGGSPVTGYSATCRSLGRPTRAATSLGTIVTVTGLLSGVTYNCVANARNANGWGPPSAPAVRVGTPGAPPNVRAAKGPTNGSIRVTWNAASSAAATVTGYSATCTATGSTKTLNVKIPAMSANVTGLVRTKSYTCKVAAGNRFGKGPTRSAVATKPR